MEKLFREKIGVDFNVFYNENKRYVMNCLRRINKELDIEGISNNSFVLLLNSIERFDESKSNVKTYLIAIAKNELYKEYNESKKVEIVNVDETYVLDHFEYAYNDLNTEYDTDIDKRFEALKNDVNEFNDEVVDLWVKGLSYEEMSIELDLTIGVVAGRMIKFRKYMRNKYNLSEDIKYGNRGKIEWHKELNLCIECGTPVKWSKATRCDVCNREHRRLYDRPPLYVLQDEVYRNGYAWTGRKYGVHARTIKNWIIDYKKE